LQNLRKLCYQGESNLLSPVILPPSTPLTKRQISFPIYSPIPLFPNPTPEFKTPRYTTQRPLTALHNSTVRSRSDSKRRATNSHTERQRERQLFPVTYPSPSSFFAMDVEKCDPNPNPNSNPSLVPGVLSPKPHDTNPNPNVNPYPTTFVQADTTSFKQVVQLLTGSPQTVSAASKPATATGSTALKKPPFKPAQQLYERRAHTRNLRIIRPVNVMPALLGPSPCHNSPVLSPSMLDFPSLVLSPVTPLVPDPFNKPPAGSEAATFAEEKAIAEKGFYLHPSPRGAEPPRLLPLFPVTSPTAGYRPGCGSPSKLC
jgi:VQ motif